MQIIVPMSGFGERFRRAGYSVPKPLIEIDGKPIIAHVIDMFPGETDFIFICNDGHLGNPDYRMEAILKQYCPTGRIVGIPSHKLGPVYAVRQIESLVKPDHPVVVNYCDFTCYWDWRHFREFVARAECDGAIPAYKGFHPHTLGTTNYAYMREERGWMLDIQEKQPYTDNRMNEYASSGTYYFASGRIMLDAFRETMERDLNVGNEYYVSLAYKPMLEDKRRIAVYELQHFMQWGTPEDVAEYHNWSNAFRWLGNSVHEPSEPRGTVIVPMAGLGQRFANEGYATPKPLIPVSGRPMVIQSTHDLPRANRYVFILRADMPGFDRIGETLRREYSDVLVVTVPEVTEGQACTAMLGLDAIAEKAGNGAAGTITFGACDNGALYDPKKLEAFCRDDETDVIVWAVRGHANAVRNPQMYGWIDAENEIIKGISVKTPLLSPQTDPIVLGTFTFKRAEDFRRCVERMIARNGRINGEFYIDTCINDALELGLRCRLFEVDSYLSWGTPNDLRTFEYWQSCFHKWKGHPYRLESDGRIPPEEREALELRYRPTAPTVPESAR